MFTGGAQQENVEPYDSMVDDQTAEIKCDSSHFLPALLRLLKKSRVGI